MGIQVMVGVEENGVYRVLDFILPSWLHGQALYYLHDRVDEASLAPFERLDWSSYDEDALPYAPLTPAVLRESVACVIEALEANPGFAPSDSQWTVDDVLEWYRKLRGELANVPDDARVFVRAA